MKTFLDDLPSGLVEGLLPDYLKKQRWFGAKSKIISTVTIHSASPVSGTGTGGTDGALQAALCIFLVRYTDDSTDLYQLPLALVSEPEVQRTQAITNVLYTWMDAAGHTLLLVDATTVSAFRSALLQMADNSANPDTPSRVTSAEQSNSSIIYADQAILKLYRRLQPGENPDVEISRFLTHVAHFANIPAYLGQVRGQDGSTLAFLQAFALNQGDGWEWIQGELSRFYKTVANLPPPAPGAAPGFLHSAAIPLELSQFTSATLEAASLLGRRTAEMHLALATPTEDPAFSAEAFTPNDLASDSQRIHTQITAALNALKINLSKVPAGLTDRAAQLLGQRKELLDRAHTLATASPYRFGRRIRIHGDYHLGQVLRTTEDFLIVDFEGEPARSLEERRRKQSPLRDVAGMLRSFSYAAQATLGTYVQQAPETEASLKDWANVWERGISAAFLAAYRQTIESLPELIPQPEQAQGLMVALLLEKALYELLYELNNRPSWLHIPLGGVLSLLREAA